MTEPKEPKPSGVSILHETRFMDGEGNFLGAVGVATTDGDGLPREEFRFAVAEETGSAPEDIRLPGDAREPQRTTRGRSSAFFGSEGWNSPWEPGKDGKSDDDITYL